MERSTRLLMGKFTISMAIFNRKLLNYQRAVYPINIPLNHYKVPLNHYFQRGWNHQPVVCVCVSPGLELNSTSRHGFWHLVQKGVHVCLLLCLQRDVVLVLLRQREELEVFTKSRGSKEDSPISLIVQRIKGRFTNISNSTHTRFLLQNHSN